MPCCGAAAAERRSISLARRAHSSKPAGAECGGQMCKTDRQTVVERTPYCYINPVPYIMWAAVPIKCTYLTTPVFNYLLGAKFLNALSANARDTSWTCSTNNDPRDILQTSLRSASPTRLSTWLCPHLLLSAVLRRRCCRAPAAVDRYLVPPRCSAAKPPHTAAAVNDGTDIQTDGHLTVT